MTNAPRWGSRRAWGAATAFAALAALGSLASAGDPQKPERTTVRRESLRELGRRLFFDAAATSRMGMRSCADCHHPGHGFSDPDARSLDDTAPTKRHSQTLIDGAANPTGHWDGEFARIEDLVDARLNVTFGPDGSSNYGAAGFGIMRFDVQAFEPAPAQPATPLRVRARARAARPEDPEEWNVRDDDPADARRVTTAPEPSVDALPAVASAAEVFGARPTASGEPLPGFVNVRRVKDAATLPTVGAHLAASERYRDAFLATYGTDQVTVKRIGRAVAEYCHSIQSGESAYDRFVAGKADALSPSARRGLDLFQGKAGCASCHTTAGDRAAFTDYAFHDTGVSWKTAVKTGVTTKAAANRLSSGADRGRFVRSNDVGDDRAFKTPTLRDVARHGPYMHDGSLATLEDVVRHYAGDRPPDPNLDAKFPAFQATATDVKDIAEFLRSLTSDRRPGLARAAWTERAPETRLEFVDSTGAPLPNLEVALVPAGDVLPGFTTDEAKEWVFRTSSTGLVTFAPRRSTHVRILLPDGLVPAAGDLVPDTCRSAKIVVPVRGRATLAVTFPKGESAPETLVATHPDSVAFPERRLPATTLRRRDAETTDDGSVLATYEATYRTDVGAVSELRLANPVFGLETIRLFLDPDAATVLTLR